MKYFNVTTIFLFISNLKVCVITTITYRQRDLFGEQPETLDDLENYAEQGHSSILYLLLEALDIKDENAEFAASHVGVCSGITTLLRGMPYHSSQVKEYLFLFSSPATNLIREKTYHMF